jgi:hypothetical protein
MDAEHTHARAQVFDSIRTARVRAFIDAQSPEGTYGESCSCGQERSWFGRRRTHPADALLVTNGGAVVAMCKDQLDRNLDARDSMNLPDPPAVVPLVNRRRA